MFNSFGFLIPKCRMRFLQNHAPQKLRKSRNFEFFAFFKPQIKTIELTIYSAHNSLLHDTYPYISHFSLLIIRFIRENSFFALILSFFDGFRSSERLFPVAFCPGRRHQWNRQQSTDSRHPTQRGAAFFHQCEIFEFFSKIRFFLIT